MKSRIRFKSPINNLKIERVDPEKDLEALEKLENNESFYCNPIDLKFVTYHCENNEYFKITDNGKLVGSFLFSITKTGKCRLYTIVMGCARLAYNWALAEWKRAYIAEEKPNVQRIRKSFNAIRREQFPFTYEVAKAVTNQAILNFRTSFY